MNAPPPGNRLLATLSQRDQYLLRPFLEVVDLDARQILDAPRGPISHVYFVESGLVSVVGMASPDRRIEVGMVGYEGMTGLDVVLGDDSSPNETLVQCSGAAEYRRRRRRLRCPHCFLVRGAAASAASPADRP